MSGGLMTPDLLGELLEIPREQVVRRARAGEFPHVKIGRRYRFTTEHYAAIVQSHTRETAEIPANAWGVRRRRAPRAASP